MLLLALGVVITAVVVALSRYSDTRHELTLGSMSHQWLAAHNASQPSSSI